MTTARKILMAAGAGAGELGEFWISTFGGTGSDIGWAVAVDSADNVIVSGNTASTGAGSDDFLIAKYNSTGALQWQRTLGGSGNDIANAVAVDSADNVIVSGQTASTGAGSNDFLIAKYNSAGALQWQRTLGGSGSDVARAVAVDSADNVIVSGSTDPTGAGSFDFLIAKYNSTGALQWQRTLDGSNTEISYAVAVDSADNIIVSGRTASTGAGSNDFLIAKYNSAGALQWQRTLGGSGSDVANAVAVDSADNVIVSGNTASTGAGSSDVLIAKYNSSGALQWQRTLGGAIFDIANGVAVDSADNVIVSGDTASTGAGSNDFLIAKYNSAGALQWQRTLGGSGSDVARAVAVDSADNVIVSGFTSSTGAGSNDFLIAKLPGDGSGTGSYGPFTYAISSLTDVASNLTDASSSLTSATSSLTDAASSLTETDPFNLYTIS